MRGAAPRGLGGPRPRRLARPDRRPPHARSTAAGARASTTATSTPTPGGFLGRIAGRVLVGGVAEREAQPVAASGSRRCWSADLPQPVDGHMPGPVVGHRVDAPRGRRGARKRAAGARPGSASHTSPPRRSRRAAARAARRRCAARRARPRRARAATAARGARAGRPTRTPRRPARASLRAAFARGHGDRVGRPVRREHAAAGERGGDRGQAEAAAELEHAPAGQRPPREHARERDRARPQLRPVGQELLVLERLLVEQRVACRAARAAAGRAPPARPTMLHEIVHRRVSLACARRDRERAAVGDDVSSRHQRSIQSQ